MGRDMSVVCHDEDACAGDEAVVFPFLLYMFRTSSNRLYDILRSDDIHQLTGRIIRPRHLELSAALTRRMDDDISLAPRLTSSYS